jgi:hypothetical protein
MSLKRKTATRPGPSRPRAVVATPGCRLRPSSDARSRASAAWSAGARRSTRRTSCRGGSAAATRRTAWCRCAGHAGRGPRANPRRGGGGQGRAAADPRRGLTAAGAAPRSGQVGEPSSQRAIPRASTTVDVCQASSSVSGRSSRTPRVRSPTRSPRSRADPRPADRASGTLRPAAARVPAATSHRPRG